MRAQINYVDGEQFFSRNYALRQTIVIVFCAGAAAELNEREIFMFTGPPTPLCSSRKYYADKTPHSQS